MNRYLFLLLLSLLPVFAFAQQYQHSAFYYNNGKLEADTTFSISPEQFRVWRQAENNISTWISSNLNYPTLAERNGVEGQIIIAFDCTSDEIKNIRVVKAKTIIFNEEGIKALQKSTVNILDEFKLWQRKFNLKIAGTYYVPIDFSLIPFEPELRKRGAIPMRKLSIGGLSYPAH